MEQPRFRGPGAAGPGAGGDLLCVCLKAFPPNRNKPLISLKGAGLGSELLCRRSEPGNNNFSSRSQGITIFPLGARE